MDPRPDSRCAALACSHEQVIGRLQAVWPHLQFVRPLQTPLGTGFSLLSCSVQGQEPDLVALSSLETFQQLLQTQLAACLASLVG